MAKLPDHVRYPKGKPTWEMSEVELARLVAHMAGWAGVVGGTIYDDTGKPIVQGYYDLAQKLLNEGVIVAGKGINWTEYTKRYGEPKRTANERKVAMTEQPNLQSNIEAIRDLLRSSGFPEMDVREDGGQSAGFYVMDNSWSVNRGSMYIDVFVAEEIDINEQFLEADFDESAMFMDIVATIESAYGRIGTVNGGEVYRIPVDANGDFEAVTKTASKQAWHGVVPPHIINVYSLSSGEFVDLFWLDTPQCQAAMLRSLGVPEEYDLTGADKYSNESSGVLIEWGAYPGGAETDYSVYCERCGTKMWEGSENEDLPHTASKSAQNLTDTYFSDMPDFPTLDGGMSFEEFSEPEEVDVEFFKHPDGEVVAVMPDIPFDYSGNVTIYSHIGQHGAGDLDYMRELEPASPEEYADLKRELESEPYGYRFRTAQADDASSEMRELVDRIDWSVAGLEKPTGDAGEMLLSLEQVDFSSQRVEYPSDSDWVRWESMVKTAQADEDWATFSHIEFFIKPEDVERGYADARDPYIQEQFSRYSDQELVDELDEYGVWSEEELQDREDNINTLLTLGLDRIRDDRNMWGAN